MSGIEPCETNVKKKKSQLTILLACEYIYIYILPLLYYVQLVCLGYT